MNKRRWLLWAIALLLVSGIGYWIGRPPAYSVSLGNRALQVADNQASAVTNYQVSFNLITPGTLGSVEVQFCSNDPLLTSPCTLPTGLDLSQAVISQQSGPGDFSIDPSSTATDVLLTRTPSAVAPQAVSVEFNNVTNPDTPGAYYVRLRTFAAADGTGPEVDYGGIAFYISNQLSISAEVPPYLTFCTGLTITGLNCANAQGNFIDFGELGASRTGKGTSQMLVATNAAGGYNVTVTGATLSSGTNSIANLAANDVSRPGTPQFGFNLRSNTTPPQGADPTGPGVGQPTPNYNQPNSYRFADGDVIITNSVPDTVRLYTASYIANIPPTQAAGIYVSTLTYICLADF
ncbi:MAG TPA: hypothetical protein VHB51_01960 [Candidatus Saccharimonadales bacterium]|nr:hypothetical protein [Candidatus Saccharimonadales bacterium]